MTSKTLACDEQMLHSLSALLLSYAYGVSKQTKKKTRKTMFIFDSLRPFLVGNSFYNSIITSALALPMALIFGFALLLPLRLLPGHRARLLIAGALIIASSIWNLALLPWLSSQMALQLSDPMTALITESTLALAGSVAPFVSFTFLLIGHQSSRVQLPTSEAHWRFFFIPLRATLIFLLCNVSAPLLFTGGRPFNMTHTMASWIFTQAWVNGDGINGIIQSLLLCLPLFVIAGVTMFTEGKNGPIPWRQRFQLLLTSMLPLLLVIVPLFFRQIHWANGRDPLLMSDLAVATMLAAWTYQQGKMRST